MSRGGGAIRPSTKKSSSFEILQVKVEFSTSLNIHNTFQASMARVYEQRKVKHASCKNVKRWDWSVQMQFGDTEIFLSMVLIGGAIVHPR